MQDDMCGIFNADYEFMSVARRTTTVNSLKGEDLDGLFTELGSGGSGEPFKPYDSVYQSLKKTLETGSLAEAQSSIYIAIDELTEFQVQKLSVLVSLKQSQLLEQIYMDL